ncbi:Ni/Fe-hydrogenase, b-type cytochrome subunit [Helicobacter cholecystus]|uniref:Ni/Fe-hydrogenase, b-type cytochrome subunit n=1 Tax=Helicobacter cholecystus TaxID=45498 RepID=A0A3D8IWB6_9HELI|nr:Ni/Fe-hydrogenase, b-type cytochrome subunit [Helicobacter cholecystus]RDU69558.1 Ni/Fe-hydrogenase, b-type cytochrome subunit [Helicobacter cholecystus]VEJ24114.1 quinone-reactive Ni/Fe hydrogenase, cytochrome b subunit [Helicobacter cholecystus]
MKDHHDLPLSFWVTHWIRFICMIVLVVSGFYIAQPFIMSDADLSAPVNFLQAKIRFWHVLLGMILLGATLFKTYLFFFSKGSEIERKSFNNVLSAKQWASRIIFYLTLGGKVKDYGLYNPLQFVVYLGVYIALYGIIITGFVLFMNCYHDGMMGVIYPFFKPLETLMGGIANVRWIHHLLTWVFLLFLPVHIYMASMKYLFKTSYEKAHS